MTKLIVHGGPLLFTKKIDGAGAACSALCALHCAAGPLVPTALGLFGWGALAGPGLEMSFGVAALCFATAALWYAYRRHRAWRVVLLFVAGMLGLIGGTVLEELGSDWGSSATILAGLLLVIAHLSSWWSLRRKRLSPLR